MKLQPGQDVEVRIDRMGMEGRGVGRVDDMVVFVDKALPGEEVQARITKVKRRFAHARAERILQPAADRVAGRCTHLEVCGGCSWQELDYQAQLDAKTQLVHEALERTGGFLDLDVPRALPSPEHFFYRNKMEFSFAAGPSGEMILGLHTPGTFDRVFDLEACYLMSEPSNAIATRVRELAIRSGKPAYHAKRHEGFWRYLVIREGKNTGDTMINLVTDEGPIPNREEVVRVLTSEFPFVTSILHSTNTRRAAIAVSEREEVLFGKPEIEEQLGSLRFFITSNSFFQTNTHQAERLFELAIDWADLRGQERVLDLYAGTGAISLFLAQRARLVTGVELVPESVAMAEKNARHNGIENCRFLPGEVRSFLRKRAGEAAAADVVVADPPRAGLHHDVVRALRILSPKRIVYVSCNPSTLARDLELLCRDEIYTLERVQPIDMFPHTYHIECLVLLQRTRSS